jgi:ribosomal protein S14
MLYLKVKDIKNRKRFYKLEKAKLFYKFIFINLISRLKQTKKSKIQNKTKLNKLAYLFSLHNYNYLKLNSKTRLLRRCVFSNRNRANLRSFSLSRIVLRDFIQFNALPGYRKAAW